MSRKRRRLSSTRTIKSSSNSDDAVSQPGASAPSQDDDSTELKLAILASLHPSVAQDVLLDVLLAKEGSVEDTSRALSLGSNPQPKKSRASASNTYQSSLSGLTEPNGSNINRPKLLTRKGRTLHLYSPEDVAEHTPCSIIHNFLPAEQANDLLRELLNEAPTFERATFKMFDNVVQSPHTACFYVQSMDDERKQKTEYLYNGSYLTVSTEYNRRYFDPDTANNGPNQDIRQITPHMRQVSAKVQAAVNQEIATRIQTHYPGGRKLRYQSPKEWIANAAFVNCYDGGNESVGYHSDQLTYLGPRAVIGSLSLGVTREFRVRKVTPRDDAVAAGPSTSDTKAAKDDARADVEGQIAIHLPHNSLLVMHAEMQEEWKHSIAPAPAIDPHPVAGKKRINITYRCYRDSFHPRFTPRCRCDVASVLRCVQRKKENWGRYFWMCHAGLTPGKEG